MITPNDKKHVDLMSTLQSIFDNTFHLLDVTYCYQLTYFRANHFILQEIIFKLRKCSYFFLC